MQNWLIVNLDIGFLLFSKGQQFLVAMLFHHSNAFEYYSMSNAWNGVIIVAGIIWFIVMLIVIILWHWFFTGIHIFRAIHPDPVPDNKYLCTLK